MTVGWAAVDFASWCLTCLVALRMLAAGSSNTRPTMQLRVSQWLISDLARLFGTKVELSDVVCYRVVSRGGLRSNSCKNCGF